MWNNFIRVVALLTLVTLSGCLTGGGNNQAASGFVISSNSATNISDTTATLMGGFMNAAGASVSVAFQYDTSTAFSGANFVEVSLPSKYNSVGYVSLRKDISPLAASTPYYYRLKITDSSNAITYSATNSFTTLSPLALAAPVGYVAGSVTAPQQMVQDANNIYWLEFPTANSATVNGAVKMMSKVAPYTVTTLASALNSPAGIAVDPSGNVYYTETTALAVTTLNKVNSVGVPVITALSTGLSAPIALAANATDVYVLEQGTWNGLTRNPDGAILSVPVAGITQPAAATGTVATIDNLGGIATVAITVGGAGYTLGQVVTTGTGTGEMTVVNVTTGVVTLVGGFAVTNPGTANVAATALVPVVIGYAVATGLNGPENLVIDGVNVYWNENSVYNGAASIKYAPLVSGAVAPATGVATLTSGTSLVSGLVGSQFIGESGNYVYYTSGSGTLSKVVKPNIGTPISQVVVSNINGLQPFALDSTGQNIYWVENGAASSGLLKKVSLTGGGSANLVIAKGLSDAGSIVADSGNVYWVQKATQAANGLNADGAIMSHVK